MSEDVLDRPPPRSDARFTYGDAPSQFAELFLPKRPGPHPVVVCIHGGFWRARYSLDHLGHLCRALADDGFAAWSLEYRRLGEAGGGWPGTFDDVLAGIRHLSKIGPEHSLDASHLVFLGHSAGGHLALWAAKTLRPRAIVPLAPVADLALASSLNLSNGVASELLVGTSLEAISPKHRVPLHVKTRVIHGDLDDVVPLAVSRSYVEAAREAGDDATLEVLEGAGHFELIDPETKAFSRVLHALRAL